LATFSVGTTIVNISLPIIEDDVIEAVEEFDLMFTIPAPISDVVIAGNEINATGVIIDSTGKCS